jgi:hypothetical protein
MGMKKYSKEEVEFLIAKDRMAKIGRQMPEPPKEESLFRRIVHKKEKTGKSEDKMMSKLLDFDKFMKKPCKKGCSLCAECAEEVRKIVGEE